MIYPKWIDSVGHPPGSRLVSAGYAGAFLYVGFPSRPKSATRALVADYLANGLELACIVEDTADDALNPANGALYAQYAVNHMRALGLPAWTPVECTADRHLTVSDIPTALMYADAFRMGVALMGWTGPVGAYGFDEFTRAAWSRNIASWTHVAGPQSTLAPYDTFWQDNNTHAYVGGVQVDVNYQRNPFRTPQPPEEEMDRIVLPASETPTRFPIVLPVDRQAVITLAVDGTGQVVHGYGWGEAGGTGFDAKGQVPDQGVLVIRPPKRTGKVDVQYTSNAPLYAVIDYV